VERDPHQFLEGVIIASYAVQCHTAFIYTRGEFLFPGRVLERAIGEAHDAGFLGKDILKSGYQLDVGLDFESIAEAGSLLGTGALMVTDERDCMVRACQRLLQFYAHESCGKCTPCREGTWWVTRMLTRIEEGHGRPEDLPLLGEIGDNILFKAFCALADGAVSPITSTLKYFRDEYEEHVRLGRCPFTEPRAPQLRAVREAPREPSIPEPAAVPLSEILQ
jgi:NADH:ubiquinone oxidoreductase subunit F (NADH-binding)